MKPEYQKQFLTQQHLGYQTLRALIQRKHQIRINFSRSRAYHRLQLELKNDAQGQVLTLVNRGRSSIVEQHSLEPRSDHLMQFQPACQQFLERGDDLLEVIKRERGRLASFGQSEEKPLVRNSVMSRTYRKRRSFLQQEGFKNTSKQGQFRSFQRSKSRKETSSFNNSIFMSGLSLGNRKGTIKVNTISLIPSNCNADRRRNSNTSKLSCPNSQKSSKNESKSNREIERTISTLQIDRKNMMNRQNKDSCLQDSMLFFSNKKYPLTTRTKNRFSYKVNPIPSPKVCRVQALAEIGEQLPCRPWSSNKNGDDKPLENQAI